MSAALNLIAIVFLLLIGLWFINGYIPMPAGINTVLNLVVLIVIVLYILDFFGVISVGLPRLRIFK